MARATRSSVATDNGEQPPPDDIAGTVPAKKRKRRSTSRDDDHSSKHSRTDDQQMSSPPPELPPLKNAADVPLTEEYASKILDILDVSDNQGLLDRVFPLASSPSSKSAYSLRTLLQNPPDHPLSVLKSAVHNLFPQRSHPPSSPASQQDQFCRLALSLLEEASFHSVPFPLDRTSIIPDETIDDSQVASTSSSPPQPPRKYALVQHLPQGDYWTSLNTTLPPNISTGSDSRDLQDLPTGYAELVAVFPQPQPTPKNNVPTLGSYHKPLSLKITTAAKYRPITSGSFLDYGPWASFAPSFDQEFGELGCDELGQYYYSRESRRQKAEGKRERMLRSAAKRMDIGQPMSALEEDPPISRSSLDLDGILSPEDVESLRSVLNDVQVLHSVEELLERNRKALLRLEELQFIRLDQGDAGSTVLEQGSEEWEIAQSIVDSLTLLAALRPRTSDDDKSIIPSPAALHALQRTLPLEGTTGWQGNLPATQAAALHDDSTVKLRTGVTAAPAVPAPVAPTPTSTAPVAPNAANAASSFASYNYNYAAQQQAHYRTPTATATATPSTFAAGYRPASTAPYYAQYQPQATTAQNNYYGAQAYTSQQPYSAYQTWFNATYPQAATLSGTTSGPGTPQPAAGSALANHYQYYAAAAATTGVAGTVQQARTPAVANTVKSTQWVAPATPMQYTPIRAGQANYQTQTQTTR